MQTQEWTFEIRLGYGARTVVIDNLPTAETMLGAKQRATRRFNRGRYVTPSWSRWQKLPSGSVKFVRDFTGMVVGTMTVSKPSFRDQVRREFRTLMAGKRRRIR